MENIDISIIIPLFNQFAFTKVCLEYLARNTDFAWEVILVDNASSDETPRFVADLKGVVQKIRNEQNLGFAKACNQGARAARGRYLVFLNNDTAVHKGWLRPLLETLERRAEVGIVGPKLIYPDTTIQQAGVVFEEKGYPYHLYAGCPGNLPGANKPRFFRAVTGACFMTSKRDFFAADCFDERYVNGLEDIDLCLKMGIMGRGVFYNPASVVTHFESRSENRQAAMGKNTELFTASWCKSPKADDYKYLAQDDMEIMVNDRLGLEFFYKADADRIVAEKLAVGAALEAKGQIPQAFEHYKQVYGRSSRNLAVLAKLEELSRKVGLADVADNFRRRRISLMDVRPDFGLDYNPVEYAAA